MLGPNEPRDPSSEPAQPGFTAAAGDPRDLSPAQPGFTAAAGDPRDLSPAQPGFTAAPINIVSALEAAGFTHLVWIPDSHLGTWEPALRSSRLALVRVCREGEAIGVAIGLILGGARPLVAVQCTGFFEAGDAVRNAVHDLKLPLKLIVGVRSERAARAGKSRDNCPWFAERVVAAWELHSTRFDPAEGGATELTGALSTLAEHPAAAAVLWAE
ncbi:thiamine pyrophosphate-binding protein [Frigoriglobus tundricola]|uniref:Uncharacterized protein n=1 Tax=Frigoriglobus tundricola TaxID=2774151 RepID=A0A6M5YJE6_9BACT|nr:thiamine pyrophosphate-binding protein [Frigoriglobus tundricola]QJW94209.1 hypothetical protein FTUN_1729 [Frigoriglobus tundricola]